MNKFAPGEDFGTDDLAENARDGQVMLINYNLLIANLVIVQPSYDQQNVEGVSRLFNYLDPTLNTTSPRYS